ncbi:hypothetical protein [Terriglobus aquaticus]|uniref:Outer membrane lipoprotein-sorting protein n=1 Tax=Terriglobus aquaticus TaxID=940139 RepID=A0ABW9KLF4_9BACT
MSLARSAVIALGLYASLASAQAQTPDITSIMARVAANADRAEAERVRYTYVQHADVASRRGHKVLCREVTDSRVTPTAQGSGQQLLTLDGRVWLKNRYVPYTRPLSGKLQPGESREVELKNDENTDVDLVEHLRDNLTNTKAKDGFQAGLFPLTSKAQTSYDYRLLKRESMNGRNTLLVHFSPRDKNELGWEGDAWIDTESFQPVLVRTRLAHGIPFWVKTMLGTNVPGLGFATTYAPQPDGVWFPVTFGTEFKIHVLFFFHRQITMSVTNRDFQKTHTEANILDTTEP